MADSLISALVKDLVGKLTSEAIQEYGLLRGLEKDLSALNKTFELIQAVLYDAEEKQKTQKEVEVWLKTLKSASLEVENVLDEAKTEAMIRRLHREMGKKYRIRAFFSYRYNPVMVKFRIAHKVKDIRKQLEDIAANRSRFQLISNTRSEDGAGIGSKRETSSLMPLVKICGRDEEKKMIVDKICNQDIGITRDNDDVRVYAICGIGGIGKTTLAKLVYNDETVKTHFDLKCWVYVSSVFDVKSIIKQIIKAICGVEDKKLDEMSLDVLLGQLQNKLKGNKYVIIMDDIWLNHDSHEDMVKWEELCTALSCGAKGSTVMVTTRKEDLAKRVAIPELLHNVGVLSEKDSWSLFKMLAFPGRGEGENVSSELEREGKERVGEELVKKCNGLPLAVKSLGSLMSTKETVEKWQRVNKNFKSNIQDNVLTALRLSYDDLPPRMRICFAYCCVFSKGEELSKDTLIELWIANGFIPSEGDASFYELGEDIFDCLVGRSFFQDVVEKDIRTGVICKMHDLMHDLAGNVMKHDFTVIEPGKKSITQDEVLHLSLSGKDFKFSEENLEKLRSVRSMFVYNIDYTSNNITQIFNHVYLRVLYLNGIESSTLPESICKLIHLRYLKISWSRIEVLPESIIYLQNLQTLILERCYRFREWPKGLRYMRNLQRLDIRGLEKCEQLPPLGKLPSLKRIQLYDMWSLKGFHNDDNATSKEEILFPSLQQLYIYGCWSLVSLPNNFPKLQSLKIGLCEKLGSLPDEIQSFKDLNQITIWRCEILSRRCEKEIGEDWPKISHIPHLDIRT